MKRYIFLTNSISNIGGGQLYVAAKVAWLKSEGWKVSVWYSQRDGKILVDSLNFFADNYEPALGLPLNCLSAKVIKRVSDRIMSENTGSIQDEIIIESHFVRHSLWGEILAEKFRGVHISYIITERVSEISATLLDFYRHKLRGNTIFGIERESIPSLIPEADSRVTCLRASGCISIPEDYGNDEEYAYLEQNDLNILTISRLEKPYITTIFKEVVKFCKRQPEKRIGFIIIGDTHDQIKRKKLLKILSEAENLDVMFKGYMYPIPENVLRISDLFIGGSGSVRIASAVGIRAIVVSPEDSRVLGYFGETTETTVYRTSSDINIAVSDALVDSYKEIEKLRAVHKGTLATMKSPQIETPDFSSHAEIMETLLNKTNIEYFNVSEVTLSPIRDIILKCLCRMLGVNGYFRLKYFMRKMLGNPFV